MGTLKKQHPLDETLPMIQFKPLAITPPLNSGSPLVGLQPATMKLYPMGTQAPSNRCNNGPRAPTDVSPAFPSRSRVLMAEFLLRPPGGA